MFVCTEVLKKYIEKLHIMNIFETLSIVFPFIIMVTTIIVFIIVFLQKRYLNTFAKEKYHKEIPIVFKKQIEALNAFLLFFVFVVVACFSAGVSYYFGIREDASKIGSLMDVVMILAAISYHVALYSILSVIKDKNIRILPLLYLIFALIIAAFSFETYVGKLFDTGVERPILFQLTFLVSTIIFYPYFLAVMIQSAKKSEGETKKQAIFIFLGFMLIAVGLILTGVSRSLSSILLLVVSWSILIIAAIFVFLSLTYKESTLFSQESLVTLLKKT